MDDPIFEILDRIDNKLDNLSMKYKKVKQQRDELLAACKYLLEEYVYEYERNHPEWKCNGVDAVVVARAAITDVENCE